MKVNVIPTRADHLVRGDKVARAGTVVTVQHASQERPGVVRVVFQFQGARRIAADTRFAVLRPR